MSFESLSERLSALQESNAQLKDLIDRLATINFQPGSVPLDTTKENVVGEITVEIQQTLRDQEEDFELLQEEVYDLDSGRPGSELEQQKDGLDQAVKRAVRELKTCQSQFRRAQLIAKKNLEAAQRLERDLLIQKSLEPRSSTSSPVPGQQSRRTRKNIELSREEKTVNASNELTLQLRRTHETMAQELEKSRYAKEMLDESSLKIKQLDETYSSLDTLLNSSKNLLGTLLRSQKSDTWYLETAFYILCATIAWLFWRRILYGPTWWLLWSCRWFLLFPVQMFIKGWIGVFTTMGLLGSSTLDVGGSSVVGESTAVYSTGIPAATPTGFGEDAPGIRTGGAGENSREASGESMSEHVGRIIDEAGNAEGIAEDDGNHTLEDRKAEDKPNPKKRMFEDEEAVKEVQRKKDEL